jgi:hypothetical protein
VAPIPGTAIRTARLATIMSMMNTIVMFTGHKAITTTEAVKH